MLRDVAIGWVAKNCPNQRLLDDFVRHLDASEKQGVNFLLTLGPGLTVHAKPYLIHWFCGELFVLELTPRQAEGWNAVKKNATWTFDREKCQLAREPHLLELERLELENTDNRKSTEPITGWCWYQVRQSQPVRVALALQCEMRGRGAVVSWYYPDEPLAARGKIRCTFPPICGSAVSPAFSGTAAAFARAFVTSSQGGAQPISNTCVSLIELT